MSNKILIKFLPFEVTLTLESTNRQLSALQSSPFQNLRSLIQHQYRERDPGLELESGLEHELEHELVPASTKSSRSNLNVDSDELTSVLKGYFDDFMRREFEESSTKYAPFSHVSLSSFDRRRRLLNHDKQDDQRYEMDGIFTSESEIDYIDDYYYAESSDNQSSSSDNQSSSSDNQSYYQSKSGDDDFYYYSPDLQIAEVKPLKEGNLRTSRNRKLAARIMSKTFDGVAIFTRDGTKPLPSSNTLQAKQLVAQADEDGELLKRMQESNESTGLHNVASVRMEVSTNNNFPPSDSFNPDNGNNPDGVEGNGNNGGSNQQSQGVLSYNIVIIVAIVVASCSILLLAFALFLAFRRRHKPIPVPVVTKEISPTTRNTEEDNPNSPPKETAPKSKSSKSSAPPVAEMTMHPQHDDNISDYTESVYSAPMARKMQNGSHNGSGTYPRREWLTNENTGIAPRMTKASNRFNPRYIISNSKRSNSSASGDEHDLVNTHKPVSQEMEGVPQLTSPMMRQALRTSGQRHEARPSGLGSSNVSPLEASKRDSKPHSQDRSKKGPTHSRKRSESGLFPADVIDDDIATSLSAYPNQISKRFSNLLDEKDEKDDNGSIVSYESYGFSLDGVGDQSTLGTQSTRYGY